MIVGILYIAIGKYWKFWDEFYSSCESNFLLGNRKEYFVFTDRTECCVDRNPWVHFFYTEDLGWPYNTLNRFKMFYSIEKELFRCDYLFFFNGNTIFLSEIKLKEFIPQKNENYLLGLSWDVYKDRPVDKYPYERHSKSTAFIPFGSGEKYYQGGISGGRTQEYLSLIHTCLKAVEQDYRNNIIAVNHDESHLNKQLLHRRIKVVGLDYGCPEEWNTDFNAKIIFRDKNRFLGKSYIDTFKGVKKVSVVKKIYLFLERKIWGNR